MNTRIRTTSLLAATLGALLLASTASAGFMPRNKSEPQQSAQKPDHQSTHQPAPKSAPRDKPMARHDAQDRRQAGPREPRGQQQGNAWASRGNGQPSREGHQGGDRTRPPRATPPVADARPEPARGDHHGARGAGGGSAWNGNGNRRGAPAISHPAPSNHLGIAQRPAPRVVRTLPVGHRSYNWNGGAYYHYGRHWYRPYGASYVVVRPPYGLFVSYLPSYYSTFWYGGVHYFHADSTYYVYEPVRRGYVVSRSPYGDDDEEEYSTSQDEDLYVYPAQGQSEQQQSDDRYECHRWAVDETGYDPIDSDYDADRRADYLRALTACLTGRGYSVR